MFVVDTVRICSYIPKAHIITFRESESFKIEFQLKVSDKNYGSHMNCTVSNKSMYGSGVESPPPVQEVMRSNLGYGDSSRCLYCLLAIQLRV